MWLSRITVLYRIMTTTESFDDLPDQQLLEETQRLATRERESTALLVAALAELDARRLYLAQGYSSLFAYCTRRLHFSEHSALNRIEAARAARVFPSIIDAIADGALSLTSVRLLRPVLTADNHRAILASARHKSTKEVEILVAGLRPKLPVPATVRKLPELARTPPTALLLADPAPAFATPAIPTAASPVSNTRRPIVKPLSAATFRLQITMSQDTHDKLRRAQALMRHRIPAGDPATIVDRALDALLRELEKTKHARVEERRRSRTSSSAAARTTPTRRKGTSVCS